MPTKKTLITPAVAAAAMRLETVTAWAKHEISTATEQVRLAAADLAAAIKKAAC